MKIQQFVNSVFTSNSYIVHDGRNALIIDVGDFPALKEYLTSQGLALRGVFITHTHFDHIYGLPELMSQYPEVPVYTTEAGIEALREPKYNFSRYHGSPICIISEKIISLQNNAIVSPCETPAVTAIHTPGHDSSCVSFVIGNALFTGDSYIPDVKVIATFPRSDKKAAREWYARLQDMAETYDIYPGHGPVKLISL